MKTLNNIKNFLYCKDYFINLFENNIYVFNFQKLISISNEMLEFKFEMFSIKVYGQNFVVKKMLKNEILVHGVVKKVEYEYYE